VEAGQTTTGKPIAYAFVSQSDSFIHEQQATPVQLRQSFAQDDYGNQTQEFNFGQVCGGDVTCGDDEVLTYTDYIYDQERYIFNRPLRIYQTDAQGNLVSDKRLYYDGEPYVGLPAGQLTRGDLTRQEDNLEPNGAGRSIPTKRQQFDAFGNVIGMLDANGKRTTVEYDALMHVYPVLERLHLDDGRSLTYAASYHYGFGKVSNATDYNGHPHTYVYDTFGRLSKIIQPGDTLAQPTQQFRYEIGSPRSAIISEHREQSGTDQVFTTIAYFDGLGRKLQTRSEAEGGQVVVTDAVSFNARQTPRATFLPYYDSGLAYKTPDPTLPHETYFYDPLARIVRRQQPDGSVTTVIHKPLAQLLFDEEDNNPASPYHNTPRTLIYDGLERLVSVEEMNIVNGGAPSGPERYTTRYSYDSLGNLIKIVDAQGNVKTQTFDALKRKLSINDPDRGEAFFIYDDAGNVIETVDAKGQRIRNSYDAANRILTQNFVTGEGDVTPEVTYHYDADLAPEYADAQNTLGRLAWVADESGREYLSYDAYGSIVGRVKRINAPGGEVIDFAMRMRYDAMQRLVEYTYPDGVVQHFEYNDQSFLEAIPGFVNNIDYTALGKRIRIATADGATTTYEYDVRQRLSALRTVGAQNTVYQDWRYHLDGVSNILRIDDLRPALTATENGSQSFTYDGLNRLLTTRYADGGQIEFGYDPLGNLVRKSSSLPEQNLGAFQMGQNAGPHALTQASGATWRYDANGNLVERVGSGSGFTYSWDFRNRLTQITGESGLRQQNYYDYADQRMVKWVTGGAQSELVLYPDRSFEVRGDQLVKYLFANDQRVAEVRTAFDKTRLIHGFHGVAAAPVVDPAQTKTLFYHGDHLGSATVLVDPTGQVVERRSYHPFGQTHTQAGASMADYSYTGKELDVETGLFYYGARYYDPALGRFISVDPLYFEQPEKGLADPQMLNLYAYARNNPVHNLDPDGRDVVIAYGVGDQERTSLAVVNRLAQDLRRANIRVHVVKATDLQRASVQKGFAEQRISAAIFVGHGHQNTIALEAKRGQDGGAYGSISSTPDDFAKMAGVRRGGVVAMLGCNVVTGTTDSEKALAQRGINTIGFKNDFEGRTDGLVRSTAPFDPSKEALPDFRETPWVEPSAVKPHSQTGPHPQDDPTLRKHIDAAEKRVDNRIDI
jgi:RHS repeat-associated protein